MRDFGWCFVGAGAIASRVLKDLGQTNGGYMAAVCSQSGERAKALADQYGAKAYTSLEEAIDSPDVRAVYIATPNHLHKDQTLAAIARGKPVLCEKPFALCAADAREMIDAAQKAGVYLMEGMWTRFNPAIRQTIDWVNEGRIGRILTMTADFASRVDPSRDRIYDPAMGGGALLDVGVYTVAFARFMFGQRPETIRAVASYASTGIDSQCAATFGYPGGATARLFSAVEVAAPHDACIYGETGSIRLSRFWAPDAAELTVGREKTVFSANKVGEGLHYEFDAVMDDIRAGKLENEWITHAYTLEIMETLDAIREAMGGKAV